RAAADECLTPLLLWPRCGRSCARAQVPPACIDRYSSPYARPVCLAVSSCGFLGFLTLSPLSVKLGQAQTDPYRVPAGTDASNSSNEISLHSKAAEDCRTPKADAFSKQSPNSRSVLDCR